MFELAKTYQSKKIEEKWYSRWLQKGAFHLEPETGGKPYCIVMPPPNITGILHMGHALNITIQDILIRYHRMQGQNALWIPGTDHAGIATQNVVERALQKEGKSRKDFDRHAFLQLMWDWREKYGNTISNQLKKLGIACDWARERFTMDEGMSNAVTEVFIRLYKRKLIYRDNYIINWCPRCQTALSDEETEHIETKGHLYYIKYLCQGGKKKDAVVVATTRPETLLGDVAIAVNPRDERYRHLAGKQFRLPILDRPLSVIYDDFVDPEFGTGVVKVTPAHDPNDFDVGQRHELTPINVMNPDGTMNENSGPYSGLDRFECRKRIIQDLSKKRLLEKVEEHRCSVGHCYRCGTIVEPRLSLQWFVKMAPLAGPAMEAVQTGKIQFIPERWTKVYLDWMENIRDWCISRQILWGHRIPVFYCSSCNHEWATKGHPDQCPACSSTNIRQDEDVLDTWFSSWLWPFSVLGWPQKTKDLAFYYPTDTLVTGSEIIFFWVARMIVAGIDLIGDIPFHTVYIHGTVRDDSGQKMSKSLGNSIDPVVIIDKFSTDALRFSLMMITAGGQDVYVSNEKFEIGRNFLTKIWNAARFLQMHSNKNVKVNAHRLSFAHSQLSSDDKHILAQLHELLSSYTENLDRFRLNDVAKALYEFVWHQYCDWYIEYAKVIFADDKSLRKEQVLSVAHYIFSNCLLLLHPFIPFITEELWHGLGYGSEEDIMLFSQWSQAMDSDELATAWKITKQEVSYVEAKHDLVRIGRTLRSGYHIAPLKKVDYIIKPAKKTIAIQLEADKDILAFLLNAKSIQIDTGYTPGKILPNGIAKLGTIFMPIEGLFDIDTERQRLIEQLNKVMLDLAKTNRKLANVDFIQRAPEPVVEMQKGKKQLLAAKCEKLRHLITLLPNEGKHQYK